MERGFIAEKSLGYQQITLDAVTSQALTIPAGTSFVLVAPEAAIRVRDDGTNPTASVGYPIPSGAELKYTGTALTGLKFISQSGNAVINAWYFGQ